MENTRVSNSKRNIASGILRQITVVCLSFVTRTAVLYSLGKDYLGLDGLFTYIIQILNLADFDFATIFLILLYKPVAEQDTEKVCAILNTLKKIYFRVGLIIMGAGILLTPFLEFFVPDERPADINIYILYFVFVANAALTYMFFAYKGVFLIAAQRKDIENRIHIFVMITVRILQIIMLLIFKNYYYYIVLLPLGTLAGNYLQHRSFDRYFPQYKPGGTMDADSKKKFDEQIGSVYLGKIGDIARNGFDGIIISAAGGLTAVAMYDNYMYIFNALYAVIGMIILGAKASVGNSIATQDLESNYKNMRKLNMLFMWIISWCSICLICIYQPFMTIWMKNDEEMLLSMPQVVMFGLYFYILNMTYIGNMFFDAKGLFYEGRLWLAIEAAANVILNITLGYFFGITGVLAATLFTVAVFTMFCRTNVLFKHYYKNTPGRYFADHLLYFVIYVIAGSICYFATSAIQIPGFAGLILKLMVCAVLPNVIILIFYSRLPLWKDVSGFLKKLIRKA
ncbi:MAG: hypothetical protein IKR23_00235 [Lachnospiraceae bacterium]|nr:hypothetical protein [Lachnospiraceae bacterium]